MHTTLYLYLDIVLSSLAYLIVKVVLQHVISLYAHIAAISPQIRKLNTAI